MKGLTFYKSGEISDSSGHSFGGHNLIYGDNDIEIIIVKGKKGRTVVCNPLESKNSISFYFLLEGKIEYTENNKEEILKEGDSFCTKGLETTVYFNVLEDLKLLWFTNEPKYKLMQEYNRLLKDKMETLNKKDSYTTEHCNRVGKYFVKVAEKLNIKRDRINDCIFAALFHDIGKINIPNKILNKPEKLSAQEFEYIKRHPIDGYKLLCNTVANTACEIVLKHHERLDGSGYPNGIKGDDIPIEARIISVVDSYDAMTSDRPYRKAMSPDEALKELKRLSEIHYDKNIVLLFEEVLRNEGVLK